MKVPEPAPWVSTIPEYVPGRSKTEIAREYGVASPIKLASNENPLGPSPKALAAMHSACGDAHLYPDPDSLALRVAAARFFGSTRTGSWQATGRTRSSTSSAGPI